MKQEGQIPTLSREYLVLQKIHSSQNQKTRSHTKYDGKARISVVLYLLFCEMYISKTFFQMGRPRVRVCVSSTEVRVASITTKTTALGGKKNNNEQPTIPS